MILKPCTGNRIVLMNTVDFHDDLRQAIPIRKKLKSFISDLTLNRVICVNKMKSLKLRRSRMTHVSILRTHTCVTRHSYSLHQYPDISALNRPNQYAIQQNWKISLINITTAR